MPTDGTDVKVEDLSHSPGHYFNTINMHIYTVIYERQCMCAVVCTLMRVCVCVYVRTLMQVYTVGPDYAHAEARKSPALDGKVERDSEGKEIRYPVMLTAMEKLVARKVCLAFKVRSCTALQWLRTLRTASDPHTLALQLN